MTNNRITHPTFDDINAMVRRINDDIRSHGHHFDQIIALARGGAVGGTMLSHLMKTPVIYPAYSSKQGAGDDRNHDNTLPEVDAETILIFDDILDTGRSVQEVYDVYTERGHCVKVAALYFKHGSVISPDYVGEIITDDVGFIYFPWELV